MFVEFLENFLIKNPYKMEICDELGELESEASFTLLRKAFKGTLQPNCIVFDSPVLKGKLIKICPAKGLRIRKWKLTVFEKFSLQGKVPAGREKKVSLIYFLTPSAFNLKHAGKKLSLSYEKNNLLVSNNVAIDFCALPNKPVYVIEITFTISWLLQRFQPADPEIKDGIKSLIPGITKHMQIESCQEHEYEILYELGILMFAGLNNLSAIHSRITLLISYYFGKTFFKNAEKENLFGHFYSNLLIAEAEIIKNLLNPLKIEMIAKTVNMSQSSLLRQFKRMYGKSLQGYYIEKKMELAKLLIVNGNLSIKDISSRLGYTQSSHFIDTFKKVFGYSPGTLNSV